MLRDQTIGAPLAQDSAKPTGKVPRRREMPSHASRDAVKGTAAINARAPRKPSMTAVLPIMGVVLLAFLVIGLALPVLPLHVHRGLGLSTFVVGLVTGSQFAASLISRVWSGHYADGKGSKRAIVV